MDEIEILKEIKASCINVESQKLCESILEELSEKPYFVIVSQVLKDAWHAFNLIYISKTHPP